MTRKEILHELDRETEYYSAHTRSQYFSHAQDYLDYVGDNDWQDRDILYNYTKKLKKKGHAQSHINYLVRGPIGALFRAHGLRIPVKLPRTPVSLLDLAHRVRFTKEEVEALISAVKSSNNATYANIMALSTTYGLRASEMRFIRKDDAHPKKKTIFIHTLKGGEAREHVVPDQVAPFIFGYDYPTFSDNKMYEIFKEITGLAGIDKPAGKGYHAIRHSLASELIYVEKVDQPTVFQFLRWRGGGMLSIYATPFQPEIDEQIFAKHPFLKYWE
ncbi:hypothetical protein LCGC14_0787850 [marine sediment metagenome]|uniref:Tyr recombinase domain-containing protein n=1 Tax=marine sediment metagenome TaxID=412755 RepID=A0A0F9SDF5_9ZZZZ